MRSVAVAALTLLSLVLWAVNAFADEPAKLALLIGNKAYTREVGPLTNPHNDTAVVAAALKRIGFSAPVVLTDQKRSQTLAAVRQFASRLAAAGPGAIGFLYYSGHGAAEQGTNVNYLIPVDAGDPASGSFWDEAVKLDDITRLLLDRAPQAAHFVVFDACRNELKLPDKAATKGFAVVPTLRGMFVAFASEFGRTASDIGDKSGPYAAALAAELVKPGMSHLDAFQNVKETVGLATQHRQVPWELNGLSLRVYLAGKEAKAEVPTAPAVATGQSSSEAERAWMLVKDSKSIAALEAFVKRFGDTFYGDLARTRLAEVRAVETERQRLAKKEEDRKKGEAAAERKKLAEAKQAAEAERQRLARKEEERKKAEASAAADRKKLADAKQAAEADLPRSGPPTEQGQQHGNARQQYETAYGYFLQQDYDAAERDFADFVARHPADDLTGNAQYWLGESFFVRGQYKQAAAAFLKGYQTYGKSSKAPDCLLKLAMSLDRLGHKAAACSSFGEALARFPNAPAHVTSRAKTERAKLACE